ncbi:MAG: hemolysin family protein [Candidatus Neomarinimicrobiota bacterium]
MNTLLFYFLLALVVSFICSLMESVILSVSFNHIFIMKKKGNKAANLLEKQKKNINRPLAAILTLNTIANTVGAAGVGAATLKYYGSEWVAILTGILTLSILIFSEIIPKTLGAVYFKKLTVFTTYTVRFLTIAALPFVYLSEAISKLFKSKGDHLGVTREEMIAMAERGEDEGTLKEQESDVIENLLHLRDVTAEAVLTPRSVVFALQKDETVKDVVDKYTPIAFSRIPIYDKDLDNVIGVVHRYDLIQKQADDDFDIRMEEIMEPISTIIETTSVATILDEFVKKHQQIFMVEDKFGTIVGLITLEDAIETLLGVEIVDEHDSVIDMRKLAVERRQKRISKQKHSDLDDK